MPVSSTVKSPEVIEDAVYQIRNQNGPIRRYVRAVKIYGDKGIAECEIFSDTDPEQVGNMINVDLNYLAVPDQYPKYQFNPNRWLSKVSQTHAEKEAELDRAITAAVLVAVATTSSVIIGVDGLSYEDRDYFKKLVATIKDLLEPVFGGFTLALFIGFIKNKIERSLESRHGTRIQPRTFQKKISDMSRIWSKKASDEDRKFADHVGDNTRSLTSTKPQNPDTGKHGPNYESKTFQGRNV